MDNYEKAREVYKKLLELHPSGVMYYLDKIARSDDIQLQLLVEINDSRKSQSQMQSESHSQSLQFHVRE